MRYRTIDLDISERVATVTLARPDDANTVDLALATELEDVSLRIAEDPSVGAAVLRGSGRFFCGGGDLKSFAEQGEALPGHLKAVTFRLHGAISRFASMDAPVICAVNGTAAGAGVGIACAGDVVLAARSARFVMAYTRVGLTPDGSSTWWLPRIVGLRRALDLTLTNRTLTAEEAEGWGLVTRVVDDERLDGETSALARSLADGPRGAIGAAKRLLRRSLNETLETQMEAETLALADAARRTGVEGVAAFVQKREPRWTGS